MTKRVPKYVKAMTQAMIDFYEGYMVTTRRNEVNQFRIPQIVLDEGLLEGLEQLERFGQFCKVRGFKCEFGDEVGVILVSHAH